MRERCLRTITELAGEDDRVVFVGSDLGVGAMNRLQVRTEETGRVVDWRLAGHANHHSLSERRISVRAWDEVPK